MSDETTSAAQEPMVTIRMERACWLQIVDDIESMCGTGAENIEILQCAEVSAQRPPYDREVLVEVVIYHYKRDIKGCACGWSELGRCHGQHVADVYEATAAGLIPGQGRH